MSASNEWVGESEDRYVEHVHAPAHLFRAGATYFITAKTYLGHPHLEAPKRRAGLIDSLRFATAKGGWALIAWVVLANHYHTILLAPEKDASGLSGLVKAVHRFTANQWNREDDAPGRTVWYRSWDTCLTHTSSFYARLNYIHHNPVKHRLCESPEQYPFSSYSFWRGNDEVDLAEVEGAFPWDRLNLE